MKKVWLSSLLASSLVFSGMASVGAEEIKAPKERPKQVIADEKEALKQIHAQRKAIHEETKQLRLQIREIIKQTPKAERKALIQQWMDWKNNHFPSKEEREQRKAANQERKAAIKSALSQKDFAQAEQLLQSLLSHKESRLEASQAILDELKQLAAEFK